MLPLAAPDDETYNMHGQYSKWNISRNRSRFEKIEQVPDWY
jgi:hypothetical protein